MFLRRIVQSLKTQNWTAIGLDLLSVIKGEFVASQLSNSNKERNERRETARLLHELKPALTSFTDFYDAAKVYYATTRAYADRAFAGWRGDPAVSDEQFVIAAYQASQIYTLGLKGETWSSIFGGDRLREIENADVRRGLTTLMTVSYDQVDASVINTSYREDVRKIIPEDIQDAIRAKCGDQPIPERPPTVRLPATCDLALPDVRFAAGAAALRARPDLVGDLRWHRAAVESFMGDYATIDQQVRQLQREIDKSAD
jgi:hypothetical protein